MDYLKTFIYVLNLTKFFRFFVFKKIILIIPDWISSFYFEKMSDFEEKSGRILQKTDWGNWSQSLRDVTIEVELEKVFR